MNEQNPQAVDFYAHFGFRTYRRTERDEEGGPYPLLYMRLPADCPKTNYKRPCPAFSETRPFCSQLY